jgi:aldehyde:ferredoxin oxidoreductase
VRTPLGGYHGRYLRVDLSKQSTRSVPIPEDVLRNFIGGSGLAAWLLLQECPDHVEPLGPGAPLVFVFSPLVGSPLTTSAKFTVAAKSPLTDRINDSLSSSHFAIAGKKTGCDAIVVMGAAETPTCLVIDPAGVRFEPAADVWGRSGRETEAQLRQRFGRRYHVATIGPAGENLVRYATVSHDGRHAARGGLGAVMGAKRLKAVAVWGDRLSPSAHPRQLINYAKRLSELSFGPATAKYRELGTVSNLLVFNRLGALPTRNFQEGSFAAAPGLAPDAVSRTHERTRASCAACTIGCEHIFHQPGRTGVRLEYENLFALGPLCGISDPDVVLSASRYCDDAGLDTISAGASVAFGMECAERGLIDAPQLRFGNGAALLEMLRDIARQRGLGETLSQGVRAASRKIGQGSADFAPHVKGLEIPGYEPRALQSMALGFAVSTRGADHNRSGAYQVDFSDQVDRLCPGDEAVPLAIATEDEAALMDSLILCKFLRGVFDDRLAAMAEMLRLVTGWNVGKDELQQTARRIVTAKKWFNIRQGWTPAEDTLPPRFFTEGLQDGVSHGARLSRERLGAQIRAYNQQRGWTDDGWIPQRVLSDLHIVGSSSAGTTP